jgi:hypothetical protein
LGALNGPNRKIKTRIVDNPTGTLAQFAICNVLKFAADIPAQSLVGLALVLALVVLLANRMR